MSISYDRDAVGESFMREVIAGTGAPTVVADERGTIIFANSNVEAIVDSRPEELVDTKIDTIVSDHDMDLADLADEGEARLTIGQGEGTGVPIDCHVRETKYDGQLFYVVRLREMPASDTNGTEIDSSMEYTSKIFEEASEAILVIDIETREIRDCNRRACSLLEYPKRALLEQTVDGLVDDQTVFSEFVDTVRDEGRGQQEFRWQTRDLETVPTEVSASVIDIQQRPHLLAFVRDLSDRYDRNVIQELLDRVPQNLFVLDLDGNVVEINETACRNLGYSRAELLEMDVTDINPEYGDTKSWGDTIEQARTAGVARWTTVAARKDGSTYPVECELTHVTLDQEYLLAAAAPATESAAESGFRDTEGQSESDPLFRNADVPIAEYKIEDESARLTRINSVFSDVFGYDSGEITGRLVEDTLVPPDKKEEHRKIVKRAAAKEQVETEITRQTIDGPRDFLLRTVPFDVNGSQGGYVIYTDITDKTQEQNRLQALNAASQDLLTVETAEETAETVIRAIEGAFDFPFAAVFECDRDEDRLVPLAATETTIDLTERGGDETIGVIEADDPEMRPVKRQEARVIEDYQSLEGASHPDAAAGRVLLLPINGYGMLAVGRCRTDSFSTQTREILDMLADTAHASFIRLEREKMLRQRSLAMDSATDGIALLDESGHFTYVNEAYARMYCYDGREELIGKHWQELYGDAELERLMSAIRPVLEGDDHWRGEATGQQADGSPFPQELSLTSLDGGGMICIARDISRWKELEQQLKQLNEASHELTRSKNTSVATERALEAACDILGVDIGCVRLLNDDETGFERAAVTDEAEWFIENWPAFDLHATAAGRAFRQSELVSKDRNVDEISTDIPITKSYHYPLGDHGTLSLFERPSDDLHETTRQHGAVLAASVSAALDRTERESQLRENKREFRRQRDELESLNRINTLVRDLVQGLVDRTERDAIERMVCQHMMGSDLYESAWVGRVQIGNGEVVPQTGAGVDQEYLDALETMPASQMSDGIVKAAIESRTVKSVRQHRMQNGTTTDNEDAPVSADETYTKAAIPLVHGDHVYGVLVVCTTDEATLSDRALENFEMLGDAVGFAIHAARSRELLLTDKMTELEFEVTSPDCLAVHVSAQLDCYCRIQTSARIDEGLIITYLRVEGASAEAGKRAAEEMDIVDRVRIVRDDDGEGLLEVTKEESASSLLRDAGAKTKHATAKEGTGRIIAEIAPTTDIREIVQSFENANQGYSLIAKREVDKKTQTTDELRKAIDEQLTEKQRIAMTSAFAAGYYEWPRETTAETLAESLDISSSTLHQHLRSAEKKLLGTLVDAT